MLRSLLGSLSPTRPSSSRQERGQGALVSGRRLLDAAARGGCGAPCSGPGSARRLRRRHSGRRARREALAQALVDADGARRVGRLLELQRRCSCSSAWPGRRRLRRRFRGRRRLCMRVIRRTLASEAAASGASASARRRVRRLLMLLRLELAIVIRCRTACPIIVAVVSKCVIVVVVINNAKHTRFGGRSASSMRRHRLAIQHRSGLRPAAQRRSVVPRQHGGKERRSGLFRGRDVAWRHQRRGASPLAACRRRGVRRCSGSRVVCSKSRGARRAQRRHRHSCRLGSGCRRPRRGHGHWRAAHSAPAASGRLHGSGSAWRQSAGAKAGGIACASAPAAPRPRPRQVAAPPAAAARGCACALAPATVRRAARPAAGRRTGRLSLARHAARLARHRTRLRPAQRGERLLHRCATRAPGRAASAAVDARSRRERALAPAFARTFESLLRISAPRLVRV